MAGAHEARQGDYNTVMKYRTSKPQEYFLVECRTRMGLDRDLPTSGLAVYHCDITGSNEFQQGTAAKHYQCALLQADGRRDLELDVNLGDGGDLYGEISGVALSAASVPHSREWDGRDSGLVISDIGAPGEVIAFTVGEAAPALLASGSAEPMAKIPDNRAVGIASAITLTKSGTVARAKVQVDIKHPYIGDLRVALTSPAGRRTVLHPQLGGPADDLMATYDSAVPGVLSSMIGQPIAGDWILNVADLAKRDVGTLRRWSIELESAPVGPVAVAEPAPPRTARGRTAGSVPRRRLAADEVA